MIHQCSTCETLKLTRNPENPYISIFHTFRNPESCAWTETHDTSPPGFSALCCISSLFPFGQNLMSLIAMCHYCLKASRHMSKLEKFPEQGTGGLWRTTQELESQQICLESHLGFTDSVGRPLKVTRGVYPPKTIASMSSQKPDLFLASIQI